MVTFLLNRDLSIVRNCSNNTIESRSKLQYFAGKSTCVGICVLPNLAVIAATIIVGLYLLPISFCTMSTGRSPPCSEPITGLKLA